MGKRLFILVEGNDDVRFFEVLKPLFEKKYSSVTLWSYAQIKREKIKDFLRSIKQMKADYLYVKDINSSPCVTKKKEDILDKIGELEKEKIIIVVREIESWYLAGLDDKKSKDFKIRPVKNTDKIDKQRFYSLNKKFDSNIDFMVELLKHFSIEMAKVKNKSFKYFIENCIP